MDRTRLPDRRVAVVLDFDHGEPPMRYRASYSLGPAGEPAEVFLNHLKQDSTLDAHCRDSGILLSLCLQYGIPVGVIRKSLGTKADGTGGGPTGRALDLIMKDIGTETDGGPDEGGERA